jgi:hypothetical protein
VLTTPRLCRAHAVLVLTTPRLCRAHAVLVLTTPRLCRAHAVLVLTTPQLCRAHAVAIAARLFVFEVAFEVVESRSRSTFSGRGSPIVPAAPLICRRASRSLPRGPL